MTEIRINTELKDRIFKSAGMANFFGQYNVVVTILLVLASLLVIALFFVNVTKLGHSADNERKRQEAKSGIMACIICGAVLGGLDVIYAILSVFVFG